MYDGKWPGEGGEGGGGRGALAKVFQREVSQVWISECLNYVRWLITRVYIVYQWTDI